MDVVIVGINVAKDKLDVGVRPSGERFVVSRTETGLEELTDRLRELGVAVVGLEATGGYETVVAASLSAAGLPVVVVNPAQVRAFANALGKRAKTDPIDVPPCYHPGADAGWPRRAPVNGCCWVGTGFGLRIDGDDRMVRASFRLSFGGPSLVDRDRLRTRCGQLERISLSGFVVAPPDRPSRLRPYLLHKPGFDKLGYGPLGPRFGPAGGTRQ